MTAADRAPRRRRLLMWGLTASLALNGFLVGALATDHFFSDRRRGGTIYFETRFIGENLPDQHREALVATVREALPEFRQRWRRLRELRREINRMAASPQPDRAAIEERLAEIRGISTELQEVVQQRVFDQVLTLPPEVRAELAREDED